jgi:hypothetical protein
MSVPQNTIICSTKRGGKSEYLYDNREQYDVHEELIGEQAIKDIDRIRLPRIHFIEYLISLFWCKIYKIQHMALECLTSQPS